TATALTLSYGGVSFNADITAMADVDYYKLTAPSGTDGTVTVSVDARNLSLFDPKVSVYNSSGTLLATASASTYGHVATVSLTGLTLHTATDVDYYSFTAASKGTFTVTVTPSQGSGTLSLAALNSQQSVLASGQSQTGGVTLSVSLASGQQYYVKVSSPT